MYKQDKALASLFSINEYITVTVLVYVFVCKPIKKKILKKPLWLKNPKFHDIDEIVCNFEYYFYC